MNPVSRKGQAAADPLKNAKYSESEDRNTSNLYICGINPEVSEKELMEAFGKYGAVASGLRVLQLVLHMTKISFIYLFASLLTQRKLLPK